VATVTDEPIYTLTLGDGPLTIDGHPPINIWMSDHLGLFRVLRDASEWEPVAAPLGGTDTSEWSDLPRTDLQVRYGMGVAEGPTVEVRVRPPVV
jgi:hypothetical protein